MVEGSLRCVGENKQNSPWVSEMFVNKTCDVYHYAPPMSSHMSTIFPCQGWLHMMGEHRLEWTEQCKICDMKNEILEIFTYPIPIPDRFTLV